MDVTSTRFHHQFFHFGHNVWEYVHGTHSHVTKSVLFFSFFILSLSLINFSHNHNHNQYYNLKLKPQFQKSVKDGRIKRHVKRTIARGVLMHAQHLKQIVRGIVEMELFKDVNSVMMET